MAEDLKVKSLHTNYPKKQNSKFPHSVFKFCNKLPSLVTFIIYRRQGDGRRIQNLVRKPQGKVSVHRYKHGCDDNIKIDLNLL